MEWTRPTFVEISLAGEVTAYANIDTMITPPPEKRDLPLVSRACQDEA